MGDLTKILLSFRANQFIMLGDISQAFLQIMLLKEEDRNRFSFFMIENNELVAYKYKTIIFGFIASPFILNYIIRHHADMYPDDEVSRILKTRFYMDNLVVTINNPTELKFLYRELVKHMPEGGLDLRSWNSNSLELQGLMNEDGKLVTHNNNYEKVLGHKYFIGSDSLQLSPCSLNPSANTKKPVLSNISKVFDPSGLFLPVTVRGKILM